MKTFYFISDIRGISFHTYPFEDLAMILSHNYLFSTYTKVASPYNEVWLKPLHTHIDSSTFLSPSLSLPWSDSYAGRVLSGFALTSYVCSSAQVARVVAKVRAEVKSNSDCWLLILIFYHINVNNKIINIFFNYQNVSLLLYLVILLRGIV